MRYLNLILILLFSVTVSAKKGYTPDGFNPTANTSFVECSVQTTDNSVTQCVAFTLPDNSAYKADFDCTGIKSDVSEFASIEIAALSKRATGTASIEGSVVTIFDQAGSTTWDTDLSVSTNDLVGSVKGANSVTVNWVCYLRLVKKI